MRFVVVLALIGCKYAAPTGTPGDDTSPNDGASDSSFDAPPNTWLEPWTHRKPITIDRTKVSAPSGGLIEFPVAIALDDPQIAVVSPTKTDVVFTRDDGLTLLESENEVVAGDQLVAWVKLPVLDSIASTRIYLYYGNAAAPAHDPEAVWTASFISVWHLSQDPNPGTAGDIEDATSNGHHGTAEPSMDTQDLVTGRVGRALDFDGTNDFINIPSTIDVGNQFTLSAWVNLVVSNDIKTIFSNSLSGLDKNGFRLFVNSGGQTDRRILFETSNGTSGTAMLAVTDVDKITGGVWTHVAVVVDRTAGTARIFIDGVDQTQSENIRTDFLTSSDCELGRMEDIYRWPGQLDEIELASEKRSSQWILTSFTNQNDPGAFYTVGGQELAP